MNIRSIKTRAEDLVINCKAQLIRIFVLMMVVGLIPELFSGDNALMSILSLICFIAFIAFEHGYVVSTLKVVRNNAQALKDDDAFVGFSRFKELASTYFIMFAIYAVLAIILGLLFTVLFVVIFSNSMDALIAALQTSGELSYASANTLLAVGPAMIYSVVLFVVIVMTVMYIANLYLFAAPYLLEQYQLKNMGAVKESVKFMKGFKVDLFKLDLSYLGWIILEIIIVSIVGSLLSGLSIIGALIGTLVGGLFAVYTYAPQYQVSRAIFFEEIAYQRYEQTNNETPVEESVTSEVTDQKEGE